MSTFYAKYSGVGGGGGGNITDINGQVGPSITVLAGTGISVTTLSNVLTISNTGSSITTGNLTDVGTDGIVITGGTGAVVGSGTSIAQHVADATHNGYLSSADWVTFNAKQAALTFGNISDVGTDGISITGGTGAVIGSGVTVAQQVANTTDNGYLSSTDWNTFNSKIGPGDITKTANTFAGFDGTGLLETIPGWAINTDTGGANSLLNITPVDTGSGTTWVFNNFQNTVTPTADLVNLNFFNMQNFLTLNGPFDQAYTSVLNNGLDAGDVGNKGNITGIQNVIRIGDGTNVSSSEYLSLYNGNVEIRSAHTTNQNINALNIDVTTNSGSTVTGSVNLANLTANFNDATGGVTMVGLYPNINVSQPVNSGLNYINTNGNVQGTVQYVNGVACSTQFQSGASVTNSVQAFTEGSNFNSGSTLSGGYTSFNAGPQFQAGSTVSGGGYTGINIGPNIASTLGTNGYNGFNASGQFTAPMAYVSGFNVFYNVDTGSGVTNSIQGFSDNVNVQTGVTIGGITSFGAYPNLHAGSTTDYVQGFNAGINIDGTVNNGVTLCDLHVNGSSTVPNLSGLNISLNGIASATLKQGIAVNDGNIQVNSQYYTDIYPASPGFLNQNGIGGIYWVKPGFPVSNTLGLLNQFGSSTVFEDDFGPDPFVGTLGVANVNMANQIAVATTKTVTAYNQMLLAASVPAAPSPIIDGGTVNDFYMLRMPGILPQGGTLTATNFYQIHMDGTLGGSSLATNAWGLYIADDGLQNYFKNSIAIDTSTFKVSNSSVGFELGSTTKAIRMSVLTTTERNALTPLAGMQIFNSSSGAFEYYNGSTWVNPAAGSGQNFYVEKFTLSPTDITNGYVTLANVPTVAANVCLTVIGGPLQDYGTDYVMIGANLDWNGLFLDGVLVSGDKLVVNYY